LGNVISSRLVRGKIHSSLGGRKAYLNFELKDRRRPERYYGATATSDLVNAAHLILKGIRE
jgi:hypothetical protein